MSHRGEQEDFVVTHDEAKHRFVLSVDGTDVGFTAYWPLELEDGTQVRDFNHTVVFPQFQGRGFSSPLIQDALDQSRQDGVKIIDSCSAVAGFLRKHEEYQDLLVR